MESLKIYIDRLKNEEVQKIHEELPAEFLEIEEEDLSFNDPIQLKGEAYIASDHLVIHLDIHTTACMPCAICNSSTTIPLHLKDLYLTHPLSEIRAVLDISKEVRESILLQTPPFVECNHGKCPEREHLKKFLKQGEKSPSDENTHFPFADLD